MTMETGIADSNWFASGIDLARTILDRLLRPLEALN
jgi:hypothetical protein